MKKEYLKIIGLMTALMLFSGFMGYMSGVQSKTEYGLISSDDYFAIRFHKDYKVVEVNQKLVDGEQYDSISVDWFRPWNVSADISSDSYGMIRVNESTGKLEFIEWRSALDNCQLIKIYVDEFTDIPVFLDDYDVWMRFMWNNSLWEGYSLSR